MLKKLGKMSLGCNHPGCGPLMSSIHSRTCERGSSAASCTADCAGCASAEGKAELKVTTGPACRQAVCEAALLQHQGLTLSSDFGADKGLPNHFVTDLLFPHNGFVYFDLLKVTTLTATLCLLHELGEDSIQAVAHVLNALLVATNLGA